MTDEVEPVAEPEAILNAISVDLMSQLGVDADEIVAMSLDQRVAVVTAAVEDGRLPFSRAYVVMRDMFDLGAGGNEADKR